MPSEFLSLDKYGELNPVRDHIELEFVDLDPDQALQPIHDALAEGMDPTRSRAIVFCHSRRATEEGAAALNDLFADNEQFHGRTAYFHAGLESDSRASLVDRFKKGEILVLFATKAFGMGMDIPNIHFVYHLGPSSTFEDYLQEVGRAGRDQRALNAAGFKDGKRIKAVCFATEDSFRKAQDRVQRGQISWNDILNAFEIFSGFFVRFRKEDAQAPEFLPVPLNILSTSARYRDRDQEPAGLYRTALYWMERLGRIRSRYLVPAMLEFENDERLSSEHGNTILDEQVRALHGLVCEAKQAGGNGQESILMDGALLMARLGLKSRSELFMLVLRARKQSHLMLRNEVRVDLTELARSEVRLHGEPGAANALLLAQAVRAMAGELIRNRDAFEAIEPEDEWLGGEWNKIIQSQLIERFINEAGADEPHLGVYLTAPSIGALKNADPGFRAWLRGVEGEDLINIRDMRRMVKGGTARLKCVFDLLRSEGAATCASVIVEDGSTVHQRITLRKGRKEVIGILDRTTADVQRLFTALHEVKGPVKDLGQVIIAAGLHERPLEVIEHCFVLLRKLGYIRFQGGLLPMAIEAVLKESERIGERPGDEAVRVAYSDAFRLKKLRLIVLQAFAKLKDRDRQDEFIREYFGCSSPDDIIALLELYLEDDAKSVLAIFREEALDDQVNRLNDQQKAVYKAEIRSNISVKAGPGTGKTHTLVLRVARLIQQEHVAPGRILVLAYNRAVVEELKMRLRRLFAELGYHSLTRSLKVQTFHGLMYAVLNQNGILNVPMQEVQGRFQQLMQERGRGALGTYLNVEFVFVDEFQDITSLRLATLRAVAPPGTAYVSVIGDPNQSIYGYERVLNNPNGNIDPGPYYEKFNEIYTPIGLSLKVNYRSTQAIINAASQALPKNDRDAGLQASNPDIDGNSVSIIEGGNWADSLMTLLEEGQWRQVALLFRSNRELYMAYRAAKAHAEEYGYRLRIKGSGAVYVKRREVAAVLDTIRECVANEQNVDEQLNVLAMQFPQWDVDLVQEVHKAWRYYREMYPQATGFNEFEDFLSDLTRREDGQLEELLRKHFAGPPVKEVVLSTMHKAKGLEYQCVLLPPGTTAAPMGNHQNGLQMEAIAEERRLYYVACSRAKQRLVRHIGGRERALNAGQPYVPAENGGGALYVAPENVNTVLSWKANEARFQAIHNHIRSRISMGDELTIEHNGEGSYLVHREVRVERLMPAWANDRLQAQRYGGLVVSAIVRYTAEDCQNYDQEHGMHYYDGWGQRARGRGYIYLVEFHGHLVPY
ncbi:MAG: UvrD-helicase domain-containing protein [Flavobacteriales bacterium]|nr:UvrD-helicase domain-containing protein [Flavobacteriales bacterium]MBP9080050.1 UvrD-helicase domain-containing protein [Flavobacteriales bacterium]